MNDAGLESVPDPPASPHKSKTQPVEGSPLAEISASETQGDRGSEGDQDPRSQRLAQIKAAIEAGEYETEEKLEIALSRLFGEIGGDDDE